MSSFKNILFLSLLLCAPGAFCQKTIDSLQAALKKQKEDTNRVNTQLELSHAYIVTGDFAQVKQVAGEAKKNAEMLGYEWGSAKADYETAIALIFTGRNDSARLLLKRGLGVMRRLKRISSIAAFLNAIANSFASETRLDSANSYYLQSLKLAEDNNDVKGIFIATSNIAIVFFKQSKFRETIRYCQQALTYQDRVKDPKSVAGVLNNIGSSYNQLNMPDSALFFQKRSLAIRKAIGDKYGIATSLDNLGNIFMKQDKPDSALAFYKQGLALARTIGLPRSAGYNNIMRVYTKKKEYDKAKIYGDSALDEAQKAGLNDEIMTANAQFSELYAQTGDFKKAYRYLSEEYRLHDSLLNENKSKQISDMLARYESEKKDKELLMQKAELDKKNAESEKQTLLIYGMGVVMVLILVLAFVAFGAYRSKKSANEAISGQKNIIEQKNKDITDSINYAKKIQEAIFAEKEVKYNIFPDAFVLLLPRDIVSGDFYWFAEKNGRRLIAAVDCTGHGVPGAFMSMIGNYFLHEVVNERGIVQPEMILSEMRHLVIRSLKQRGAEGETKDGMDMALLSFDDEKQVVDFAGANNPLWHITQVNGKPELKEYEPNKRPIGYYQGKSLPFLNYRIKMSKGDAFYIFTDGYADQFGGPDGKKLKDKKFRELLLSIYQLPMLQQEKVLLDTFNSWKRDLDQVDDVCVIGIRV